MTEKRKVGRPEKYTLDKAQEICQLIAQGTPITRIALRDDMPPVGTMFAWLERHAEFREQYARARDVQAEVFATQIIDIADDASDDVETRYREDGTEYKATDHDHINRSRLRVDARKWYASKVAPKRYGERSSLEVSGADGGPIKTEVIITFHKAVEDGNASD